MSNEPVRSILIADDDKELVRTLSTRCRHLGLDVITAYDGLTALQKARHLRPDLLLLDIDMPNGNGLSACEMMDSFASLCRTPVIFLTGKKDALTIRRCHQLGAFHIHKGVSSWPQVEPLLQMLLELETEPSTEADPFISHPSEQTVASLLTPQSSTSGNATCESQCESKAGLQHVIECFTTLNDQPCFLSIEDDDDFAESLRIRLQNHGLRLARAASGAEGYRRAFLSPPTAIILDYELPDANGDYVLRRLKESPVTESIPVYILTGLHKSNLRRKMYNLGATEFLTKPVDWNKLLTLLESADLPRNAHC